MAGRLDGLRVAALMTNGFEQVELTEPMQALREEGAAVKIVAPVEGQVQGMHSADKADAFPVDLRIEQVSSGDFDALLLPGGVYNADKLRMNRASVDFVRTMYDEGKPLAVICHAPWMLVEADLVRGRRLTSYPSLETDIRNAGGDWVDEEVVTDQGLVTSRRPADIPAFNAKMIEEFAEGTHNRRARSRAVSRATPARSAGSPD
jgi:protease I